MIEFILTHDDGTEHKVTAKPRDILFWERTTKGAKFSDFEHGVTLDALYSVAFIAAKRTEPELFAGLSKADFEATYDVLPTGDDETDPTPEGA